MPAEAPSVTAARSLSSDARAGAAAGAGVSTGGRRRKVWPASTPLARPPYVRTMAVRHVERAAGAAALICAGRALRCCLRRPLPDRLAQPLCAELSPACSPAAARSSRREWSQSTFTEQHSRPYNGTARRGCRAALSLLSLILLSAHREHRRVRRDRDRRGRDSCAGRRRGRRRRRRGRRGGHCSERNERSPSEPNSTAPSSRPSEPRRERSGGELPRATRSARAARRRASPRRTGRTSRRGRRRRRRARRRRARRVSTRSISSGESRTNCASSSSSSSDSGASSSAPSAAAPRTSATATTGASPSYDGTRSSGIGSLIERGRVAACCSAKARIFAADSAVSAAAFSSSPRRARPRALRERRADVAALRLAAAAAAVAGVGAARRLELLRLLHPVEPVAHAVVGAAGELRRDLRPPLAVLLDHFQDEQVLLHRPHRHDRRAARGDRPAAARARRPPLVVLRVAVEAVVRLAQRAPAVVALVDAGELGRASAAAAGRSRSRRTPRRAARTEHAVLDHVEGGLLLARAVGKRRPPTGCAGACRRRARGGGWHQFGGVGDRAAVARDAVAELHRHEIEPACDLRGELLGARKSSGSRVLQGLRCSDSAAQAAFRQTPR